MFRRIASFPYLLSGSYGLAEGYLTNSATAALTLGFVRSGLFGDDTAQITNRDGAGYYRLRTVSDGTFTPFFTVGSSTINAESKHRKGVAFSVR